MAAALDLTSEIGPVAGTVPNGIRFRRQGCRTRYRLRRVVLPVPPLRDRPEDLPLLVEHFRRQYNARHRLDIEGVTPGSLRRLTAHRWPGNVRELETVIEKAMILGVNDSCRRGSRS